MISAIRRTAAILCAAILVTACDSLPDGTVSIEGEQLYIVEADATTVNGGNPVRFSASDAWVAFPVGSAAEWLSVTPGAGVAGDGSVVIACSVNSGSQRSGTIRIQCGKGEADINVVQKGVSGDEPVVPSPEKGAQVKRLTFEAEYWGEYSGYDDKRVYVFGYDDANRIAEYSMECFDSQDGSLVEKRDVRLDRTVAGKITFSEIDEEGYAETYVVELDDSGRAKTVKLTDSYSGMIEEYVLTYDADGHLASLADEYEIQWLYKWRSGNLATVESDSGYVEEDWTDEFGGMANSVMNIDPNMLFISLGYGDLNDDVYNGRFPGRLDRLAMLRLTGEGSRSLLASHGMEMAVAKDMMGWPDPGVTVHKTEDGYATDLNDALVYDIGDDGRVRSIYYTEAVSSWHREYDIVSSNELVYPDAPHYGYKYEIVNDVTTETGKGTNRYVYRFEYR